MGLPNVINEINTIKSTYLPKSGGMMIGSIISPAILAQSSTTDSFVEIRGGSSYTNGSYLCLNGGDNVDASGEFRLVANTSNLEYCQLTGKPDGTLTWCGNGIITSKGGTINGNLIVSGEITSTNGNITGTRFKADNKVNDNIDFVFRHITNGGAFLSGADARNDEWHTIQTIKGWGVNGTTGYVLYSNGLIIQWGYIGSQNVTVTFPCSFSNANYTLVGGLVPGDPTKTYQQLNFKNFTSTSFYFQSYDYYTCKWLAVGF